MAILESWRMSFIWILNFERNFLHQIPIWFLWVKYSNVTMVSWYKNTNPFGKCSKLCNQLCLNIFLFLVACEFHKEEEVWMNFGRLRNMAELIPCPGLRQPRCDASNDTGHTNQSREKAGRSAGPWSPRTHHCSAHSQARPWVRPRVRGTGLWQHLCPEHSS